MAVHHRDYPPMALRSPPNLDSAGVRVNGASRAGRGERLPLVDPSTGQEFSSLALATVEDVDEVVEASARAAGRWRRCAPGERSSLLLRIAASVRANADDLAQIVVQDAGLPVGLANRDAEAAARYFDYYAGVPDKLHGESIPVGEEAIDFTIREPWGVCAIVLPFNFPLQLTARDLAPALATGNTVVLKPPEQAPLAALALARLVDEAGAPPGLIGVVTGLGHSAGQALIRHPLVDHITFTGSLATARRVLGAAANGVKPTTIELGGKSPHLVFADAQLERAIETIVDTTFRTAGQACSAGTRILVERAVHEPMVDMLNEAILALTVGPAAADPDIGPLISRPQQAAVVESVERAQADGARVRAGSSPEGRGFFVPPTILDDVAPSSASGQREIFGPVASVIPFDDEEEAGVLADATDFGLVAGLWTRDVGRAIRLAKRIRAGQIFVNTYGVGGGIELPFGGYKRSGFGRVKGMAGALEYTQVKNVCVYAG